MSQDNAIVELMKVPADDHDLDWLRVSLYAAVRLEFATLPPYLAAFWSILDAWDPVASSIRETVREEMLHMAIACNLLVAIGGTPVVNTAEVVPTYPGPLPGGVNPGLIIPLQGLTRDAIRIFMEIEYPEKGPVTFARAEEYPTIGAFYSAVDAAFARLQPPLSVDRQLAGPLNLKTMRTIAEARQAIELIKHQGEGTEQSPEDTGPDDLAHYYRFAEIYHGRKLVRDPESGNWDYVGHVVPFPSVYPMAPVRPGGYRREDVTDDVWSQLQEFDGVFSTMLNDLQAAWENGDRSRLNASIGSMFGLRGPAVRLMQMEIPSEVGNYGPCFRVVTIV